MLVPCSVFDQFGDDGLTCYAGTVKCCSTCSASVYFPIDGKEVWFQLQQVQEWVVSESASSEAEEWERQVPRRLPRSWPGDVLFCSFPLQQGVHQSLLKSLCLLSECMDGVEIREVGAGHRCHGTHFGRGLFAVRSFRIEQTVGCYAGCLRSATAWSQQRQCHKEGQFAILLDTSLGLGSAPLWLELDAEFVGNEGRFINDFRGIAPAPNARFTTKAHPCKGIWVLIVAIAPIRDGDELLVDYGPDFASFRAERAHTPASNATNKVPAFSSTCTAPIAAGSASRLHFFAMPKRTPQEVCANNGCMIPTPGGIAHAGLCNTLLLQSRFRRRRASSASAGS